MRFLNNKLFIGLSLLFAFTLPLINQNQEVKFAPVLASIWIRTFRKTQGEAGQTALLLI